MSRDDHYRNPEDTIGYAVLDPDGETLTLLDPLPAEVVEVIHRSAHRIKVTVQFVADDERMTDENGNLL
jgi:hypothetical protein